MKGNCRFGPFWANFRSHSAFLLLSRAESTSHHRYCDSIPARSAALAHRMFHQLCKALNGGVLAAHASLSVYFEADEVLNDRQSCC